MKLSLVVDKNLPIPPTPTLKSFSLPSSSFNPLTHHDLTITTNCSYKTATKPTNTITTITMARRPRNQPNPSDSASAPAPPAASSGKKDEGKASSSPGGLLSKEVEAQFKGYLLAAQKAEEEARANKPKYTGWDSPPSSPKKKASTLKLTFAAGGKGKGKQVAKEPKEAQKFGAEKWLALPAGVRLADAFEPPKALTAPATPEVERQKSKPIASAKSLKDSEASQSAGDPKGPTVPLSGPKNTEGPIPLTTVPGPVARKPVAPQLRPKCQAISKLKVKEPRVVDPVVYLPVEMEGVIASPLPVEMEDVVYHKNPKIEYREFDGDVVMQDLLEALFQAPKKLDKVLGQRKFKRPSKQKSKISPRVIRMAEEEIKRMRTSS
ncbi:hypothetical protein TWF506_008199 [Arthrobotrys conoides]|uniref:Uncharacterized protein n=1 Tax=Arthrobotrys conoides TaxID=74498 RepID=A0AAN8NCU6_9PEZI